MKTPDEIRADIKELIEKAAREEKAKPNTSKYSEAIRIVTAMSEAEVRRERDKLRATIKKFDDLFEEFLTQFTDFRLKDEEDHEKEVRKVYNKRFKIRTIKNKIKRLDYIIND